MLPAVLRLAMRSALAHWRRFVLTTVAVIVGVAFVVGSFVLTDSLRASIDRLLADAVSSTDLVVRAAPEAGAGRGGLGAALGSSRVGIDAGLVDVVRAVPGVANADGAVGGAAQLLDKANQAARFDFSFVSNWPEHPGMAALRLVAGVAPSGPGQVVVDTATATDRGLHLGSRVRIGTERGIAEATVVGLAQRGGGTLGAAGTILAFTQQRATQLVGRPGEVDGINVRITPGARLGAVRASIQRAVGPTVSVLDADALLNDARARIQERLSTFTGLLLGFAAVTLFVSAFLIWNTFSIVIAQRTRELALLRAVGASAGQVSRAVIGEGLIVGIVATALGIGAGVLVALGLERLLGAFGAVLPTDVLDLAPRTVVVAVVVGLGVTLVSVVGPARRSTRIPPIAAISLATLPPPPRAGRSLGFGLGAIALGLLAGVRGFLVGRHLASSDVAVRRLIWIALGAALVFIGMASLARYLTRPVVGTLGRPLRRFGAMPSELAGRNALRNPRRTASTASALMIGLALVTTTLVMGASVKTAYGGALRASIRADVVVEADGIVPFGADVLASFGRVAGVDEAVPIDEARATLAPATVERSRPQGRTSARRERMGISTADLARLPDVLDPALVAGGLPKDDRHLAVSRSFADENRLGVGSAVVVVAGGPAGPGSASRPATRTFVVSGIFERDEVLDDSVGLPGAVTGLPGVEPSTELVLVRTAAAADPSTVARRLGAVAAAVPNSSSAVTDRYVDEQTGALDLVLGIVDVLLFFAVLVAAMGIANTLGLSVVERTRELGLLRAVGMERRAVSRMVRVEGVLVALFGGVLGMAVGLAFGIAVAEALPADSAQLTIPIGRLVALFAVAGLLGVVAAALPARRAARLDVLDAIAEE
jgi:putative ABC transport system permease protein